VNRENTNASSRPSVGHSCIHAAAYYCNHPQGRPRPDWNNDGSEMECVMSAVMSVVIRTVYAMHAVDCGSSLSTEPIVRCCPSCWSVAETKPLMDCIGPLRVRNISSAVASFVRCHPFRSSSLHSSGGGRDIILFIFLGSFSASWLSPSVYHILPERVAAWRGDMICWGKPRG